MQQIHVWTKGGVKVSLIPLPDYDLLIWLQFSPTLGQISGIKETEHKDGSKRPGGFTNSENCNRWGCGDKPPEHGRRKELYEAEYLIADPDTFPKDTLGESRGSNL